MHRTISGISHLLKPLVAAVDTFIKVLLQKYAFKPSERALFSLRAKYGGMGLIIPTKIFQEEYENSGEITNEIQLQDTPVSTAKKTTTTTTTTTKTTTASKTKERLNDVKLQEVTNKTSSLDQLKYQRRMDCLFG